MLDGRSIIELVQSYLPGATSLKKQFDELAQEKQALLGQLAAHKPSSEDDVAAATQTDASPIPDLVDTSTQTALSFFHYLDLQELAMSARQQLEREEERVAELQKRVEGFEAAAAGEFWSGASLYRDAILTFLYVRRPTSVDACTVERRIADRRCIEKRDARHQAVANDHSAQPGEQDHACWNAAIEGRELCASTFALGLLRRRADLNLVLQWSCC